MNRTFRSLTLTLSLASFGACSTEAPTTPRLLGGKPLFAKPGGQQTLYAITVQGGLESDGTHPFSVLASADPFSGSVDGDPVYLRLPSSAGGEAAVCNSDGSGLDDAVDTWDDYSGADPGRIWKGTLSVSPGKGKNSTYSLSFGATGEDGAGWIWLVVKGGVKSGNSVTFTNARGLVSTYSTPTGSFDPRIGPFDPTDRCLTFSVTATPAP